jgi:hypothetical protein
MLPIIAGLALDQKGQGQTTGEQRMVHGFGRNTHLHPKAIGNPDIHELLRNLSESFVRHREEPD